MCIFFLFNFPSRNEKVGFLSWTKDVAKRATCKLIVKFLPTNVQNRKFACLLWVIFEDLMREKKSPKPRIRGIHPSPGGKKKNLQFCRYPWNIFKKKKNVPLKAGFVWHGDSTIEIKLFRFPLQLITILFGLNWFLIFYERGIRNAGFLSFLEWQFAKARPKRKFLWISGVRFKWPMEWPSPVRSLESLRLFSDH